MDDLETRLNEWLRFERGFDDPRRIVQADEGTIVLSRFDDEFFPRLQAALARRREIFDRESVATRYAVVAGQDPSRPRVDAWHDAVRSLVTDARAASPLTPEQQAEILAGVDSVAAVMHAVLWTSPLAGDDYEPHPGEASAFVEVAGRFGEGHDLFTREYGLFEGRRVVAFCPGVAYARRLLESAWEICTDTPVPPL
jgi:hypothetical protein